jgi:hypothetical protein
VSQAIPKFSTSVQCRTRSSGSQTRVGPAPRRASPTEVASGSVLASFSIGELLQGLGIVCRVHLLTGFIDRVDLVAAALHFDLTDGEALTLELLLQRRLRLELRYWRLLQVPAASDGKAIRTATVVKAIVRCIFELRFCNGAQFEQEEVRFWPDGSNTNHRTRTAPAQSSETVWRKAPRLAAKNWSPVYESVISVDRGSYFGFCQTPGVLTNLEAWFRRRLRLYLWRQWRSEQNRFKELCRRGISKFNAAVAAGSPTGIWRMSGHPSVQQALRNGYFDSLGLRWTPFVGPLLLPSVEKRYAKPNAFRWSFHSSGRRVSAISLLAVRAGGCLPAAIAATMSGAKNVSRRRRVA